MISLSTIPRFLLRMALLAAFFLSAGPLPALQNPTDGGCFVYPSPASGDWAWAVYNTPGSGTAQINVFNEAGDLVVQESVLNGAGLQQAAIDLNHLRNGLYICRIVLELDSGGTQSLKLFKFAVVR